MKILRLILAVFISAGLTLGPVQTAYAMRMSPAAAMNGATDAGAPMDHDCSCCNSAARCPMASCAMQCVRIGPTASYTVLVALIGHAVFSGFVPSMRLGLVWRPPTPPPRV